MRGNPAGLYECAICNDQYIVSDAEAFGGGFMPAASWIGTGHPLYWRGRDRGDA